MGFGLQSDIVVVFLLNLIVKILGDLRTEVDAIVVHIILYETARRKVNHHGLYVQRRLVEPANDILNGNILITSRVEQLPEGI